MAKVRKQGSDLWRLAFALTTMSTSFATSPDSGHSAPCIPPRGQDPSAQPAANRERYQEFCFDKCFLLGDLDKSKFLKFLKVNPPESVPNVCQRKRRKEFFLTLANKVAILIKDQREHYLFLYLAFLPTYDLHSRFPRARYHGCPPAPLEEWCRALAICSTCREGGILGKVL